MRNTAHALYAQRNKEKLDYWRQQLGRVKIYTGPRGGKTISKVGRHMASTWRKKHKSFNGIQICKLCLPKMNRNNRRIDFVCCSSVYAKPLYTIVDDNDKLLTLIIFLFVTLLFDCVR